MKLEKRSEGADDGTPVQPSPASAGKRNKPVIVYIMILFIVAFLLMALSFLSHQRSNEEVIGSLQSSMSTLQELQAAKDEALALQEELDKANAQISGLQSQLDEQTAAWSDSESSYVALLTLYKLQQQYAAEDYDGCKQTIQSMEDSKLSDALSDKDLNDVTSPAQRYQQLKESVMAQ